MEGALVATAVMSIRPVLMWQFTYHAHSKSWPLRLSLVSSSLNRNGFLLTIFYREKMDRENEDTSICYTLLTLTLFSHTLYTRVIGNH
jgi:hypothetical protein